MRKLLHPRRQQGVRQECAKLGLKPPVVQVVPFSRPGAKEAAAKLFSTSAHRLGICCYNDEVALALLADLFDARISVPETAAVIGCDNIPLGELSTPPLTTVAFNNRRFLDLLVENVIAVCSGAASVTNTAIPLSLIVRGSA